MPEPSKYERCAWDRLESAPARLDAIVNQADRAHRRRFLKEEYPQLGAGEIILRPTPVLEDPDLADQVISVVDIVDALLNEKNVEESVVP